MDNDEPRWGKRRQEKRPQRKNHQRQHPEAHLPMVPVPGVPKSRSSCRKTQANGLKDPQTPLGASGRPEAAAEFPDALPYQEPGSQWPGSVLRVQECGREAEKRRRTLGVPYRYPRGLIYVSPPALGTAGSLTRGCACLRGAPW